jgi:transposase
VCNALGTGAARGWQGRQAMKIIQLTPQQRQEIGERRRQAQDRRIYQRLSAVLWSDAGRTREEVADLLSISTRQVGQWLRIFRNQGLEELCTLHYRGDPGCLQPAQVERLKQQIAQGGFHNAEQVRTWIQDTLGVAYSITGVKDLLHRIGASYHKVSGFFWKADVKKQKQFVRKYRRHRREAGPKTRRYFVDACHPVWGVELLFSCWLLVGQRYYVGVGNGRKRLNILGAYRPDDHDYVDIRLTKENITGEQFVKLLEKLRAKHPDTEKFLLYLDNAKYYSKPVVKEWLAAHREFRLVPLPAYSPNLNLIERLWKFLRKKALNRWHKTFEAMQAAVADVLDHLGDYRDELATLMTEQFQIVEVKEVAA